MSSLLLIMNGHHLKLLKELSKDNKLSQRELSSRDFLKRKLDEYEMLRTEIEELKKDIEVE